MQIPWISLREQIVAAKKPPLAIVEQMLAYDRWDRPSSAEVSAALANATAVVAAPPEIRIRRPRWTPPLNFAPGEGEALAAEIAATFCCRKRKSKSVWSNR